jgi:hypothetical protein
MSIHPGVDLTPVETDLTQIQADLTTIISNQASIEAEIEIVEVHDHSFERWFGEAVTPSGETHVADRIGTTTTPFQADAGNNTWGSWLQILGSADTPADAGMTFFDGHRWLVTAAEVNNAIYLVQVAAGTSGAAALAAGTYSEFVVKPLTTNARAFPGFIQSERIPAGTKVWVRIWAVGENTATLDFFFGLHEYVV